MEVDNLCQDMFIAQMIVNDHIISVGGMMCIDITKALMTSCQASCSHYWVFSDVQKPEWLSEAESLKLKCIIMWLSDLRAKKQHIQTDIVKQDKCATNFSTDTRRKGTLPRLPKVMHSRDQQTNKITRGCGSSDWCQKCHPEIAVDWGQWIGVEINKWRLNTIK